MAYGCFVRTVSLIWTLFALCSLETLTAKASPDEPSADREAALLHRQLDLSGVKKWDRRSHSWQPLRVEPATVYVINLWSLHCKPCIAELPFLKNVFAGWRGSPEVQFFFIADPPGETNAIEMVAFWQRFQTSAPDADPCRSSNENLRRVLEDSAEPVTLLLDENLIVRQAFIGAVDARPLGRSIERLLRSIKTKFRSNAPRP